MYNGGEDMEQKAPRIYLKLRPKIYSPPGQKIYLHQLADFILDSNRYNQDELRHVLVYSPRPEDGSRIVIDLIQVMHVLRKMDSSFDIQSVGHDQTLVHIYDEKKKPNFLIVLFVWFTLFFGSGLAIMNFHVDVSMQEVHQRIYQLITGQQVEHPYIIQIPYSFGIGIGMLMFFNHVFRKRFNEEPSPLEVEVFLYEQNVDQYTLVEQMGQDQKK